MENNKPLRQAMPTVAAWIDQLRDAFGPDINIGPFNATAAQHESHRGKK